MNNLLIPNPQGVEKLIKKISEQGKRKIHVLADFDRTLTKAFYQGQKAGSLISHLRKDKGRYLTPNYAEKAQELFNKYHPIEIGSAPIEEKKQKMYEWWKLHKELLIDSGFDKRTIKQAVKDMIKERTIEFREGVEDFLSYLHKNNIPLVIMSSSLEDLIEEFMKQKKVLTDNVYIIGNKFEFGKTGKAVGIERIVHVFSKNEMTLESLPVYSELLKRKNVILLGDSLGDIEMVEGFDYENILKIGFYNDSDEDLKAFKKMYDVLILSNGNFDYVNDVLRQIKI